MAKMLSLEMCCAWYMLALLLPRASHVFVYVYTHAHTERMMQKSLHTICCCFHWVVLVLISQSFSSFPRGFLLSVLYSEMFRTILYSVFIFQNP
jgi:hypothetical protein